VEPKEGDLLLLSGVELTRMEQGQMATIIDRQAISVVPSELLLMVVWPERRPCCERRRRQSFGVKPTYDVGAGAPHP